MTKRSTKFICALMACAMIFTAAITVSADEILLTSAKSTNACGETATWEISGGVLTISGTGAMTNYKQGQAPWYGLDFTSVVIQKGIVSIGNYAFYGTGLRTVTIPETVDEIGVGAFRNCTKLTEVTIPEGVTQIRNLTFAGCTKLDTVKLPKDSLTRIGNMAFEGCSALAFFTVPASVNYIGTAAFNECSSLESVVIPEGVKEISYNTFGYCTALTSVAIPASVKTIDEDAFNGCAELTITAPANSNAHAFATAKKIAFTQDDYVEANDDNYAWANPFKDVDETAWYYDGVKYVNINGIMLGKAGDTFDPLASLTRAEFVTILYRVEGEPEVGSSKFADVPKGSWYDKAVAWASEQGIVNGTSATTFAPNAELTNQELATITYRYAKAKGYDTAVQGELTYSDKKIIADWAAEAVLWADVKGFMTGRIDGTFMPKFSATRGQAADVFAKFMIEFK